MTSTSATKAAPSERLHVQKLSPWVRRPRVSTTSGSSPRHLTGPVIERGVAEDPIRAFTARVYGRLGRPAEPSPWNKTPADGVALLRAHLEQTYDVAVRQINELDAGVFGVALDRRAGVDSAGVRGSPAACCGRGRCRRLHHLPPGTGAVARPAGSWHHVSQAGGPRSSDAAVLRPLMAAAWTRASRGIRKQFDALERELDEIDDADDLPQALIHIDFGGPNIIQAPDGGLVGIDWAGAGRGARLTSLAALMASGGKPELVNAFVDGYRTLVELEPDELAESRRGGGARSQRVRVV